MKREVDNSIATLDSNGSNDRCKSICEAVILAGGKSSRMGVDKSSLVLSGRTLLVHVEDLLLAAGFKPKVVVNDLQPGLGPVGGVITALQNTESPYVMFLGCDMPFLSLDLLGDFFESAIKLKSAIFTRHAKGLGFPFFLLREDLNKVQQQVDNNELSLQCLANALSARVWKPSRRFESQLFNINSPEDLAEARCRIMEE